MKYIFTIAASALLLWGCSNDTDVSQNQSIQTGNGSVQAKAVGSKVMMQAFYWDVPRGAETGGAGRRAAGKATAMISSFEILESGSKVERVVPNALKMLPT